MSHHMSSPSPIPTFQDTDGASPKELLSFLQNYTEKLEHDTVQELLHEKRGKALSLLDNLDRDFLLPFPLPHEYSWNHLHEKIKLSEVIFDMLYRMARRCGEVLCLQENIGRSIFTKLINLACSLDAWIDVPDVPHRDGYASPKALFKNCMRATSGMLQAFKEGVAIDHGGQPGWKILRAVEEECFAICQELLSAPQSGPFYIHLFAAPRLHSGSPPSPPVLKAARESESVQDRTKRTFVYVHDPTQIPLLLTLLLDVQIDALNVPALGDHFAKSLVSRTGELVRRVHEFLTSPTCVTSDGRRARAITRLVVAVSTKLQSLPPFNALADPMRLHLLVRRLADGPLEAWNDCDELLLEAFSAPFTQPILQADARSVLMFLKEEQWEDRGFDLRALAATYLQTALSGLVTATIHELEHFLRQNDTDANYLKLLLAIEKHTAAAAVNSAGLRLSDTQVADDPTVQWRRDVRTVVQDVVEPDDLTWMDDEDVDDARFVERALADIRSRFERPIYNPSAEGRTRLARHLARLPCALARHLDSPCPSVRTSLSLNPMKTCVFLVTCIMDGTDREVKSSVRKTAFIALTRSIRHQTVKYDDAGLEHIAQMAFRGMKDLDRNVRLSAGRCLVELIHLHLYFDGAGSEHLAPIFTALKSLLASKDEHCDRYKETALVTVADIAKLPEPEVLRNSIFCILLAIGHTNPLIRGVAFMQVQATAKHHKKSVYHLLSPDMDLIAPYLVRRIKSEEQALLNVCALMSTPAPSFLAVTLSHTLPHLFADREHDCLNVIAGEIGVLLHEMFLNHASRILAEVFMQTKPGKTNQALTFIVEILMKAFSGSRDELDAQHVVRGQIVEVIGDIVLKLGDPDENVVESAKKALMKVQQIAENRQSQYDTVDEAVRALLQQHMLGVVSQLNDYLQEVHGKQTVESKRRIIKAQGVFIDLVGPAIQSIAPQIMATMQTSLTIKELSETTLESWNIFLRALKPEDLSPHVGPTSATFVIAWPTFSTRARDLASQCFSFLLYRKKNTVTEYIDDMADFSSIPELKNLWERVRIYRKDWTPHNKLRKLLDRVGNDNTAVIVCGLQELKSFLLEDDEQFIRGLTSGDVFDPLVGHIMTALFTAASRDLEGSDNINQLALECIGIIGAVDPDRFRFGGSEGTMIVKHNFQDESESTSFAIHLIKDVLLGAFRSTCDIAYQNFLAYAIQELLRFCRFSPGLVVPGSSGSLPLKVRNRWKELPRAVKETVAPLLAGRFAFRPPPAATVEHPIYPRHATYREWIQAWTACLLHRTSGRDAQTIFSAFHPVVRNKDVGVAHHLLPHLVLNVLLSHDEQHTQDIRMEIMTVLQDQVDLSSASSADKKALSSQAIFMLMDHLNRWVRTIRQDMSESAKQQRKKATSDPDPGTEEYQLLKVDSILTSIDQSLMAKAALQCKAYARALMCFEQQLVSMRNTEVTMDTKVATYETMHEIYAQLDEPDGMEGISALILAPSLEHQIREHESTGRWTSAQSCWEVRLQHSPSDLKSHLGLLRCLRNLGHYDTMRTHVDGLLIRNQAWESDLLEYQVESDCIVGNWAAVESLLQKTRRQTPSVLVARTLLAMQSGNVETVQSTLSVARRILGAPISAAGAREYRRSYQAALELHMLHELQVIFQEARGTGDSANLDARLDSLQRRLSTRLDSTLPSFRSREPLLSMRRAALTLQATRHHEVKEVLGRSWLLSARLARKAGYWQTAYSAILQARQNHAPFLFVQSAKLSKATGEPLKALQEVDNSLGGLDILANMKGDDIKAGEAKVVKAKITTLRARWLGELDRHDPSYIFNEFRTAADALPEWESGWFHWGQFHDECANGLSTLPPSPERALRRLRMNLSTIRSFAKACSCGSKHIYQALSRLITLWLNVVGDDQAAQVYPTEECSKIQVEVSKAMKIIPMYKWYIALPQLISRVGHPDAKTYALLNKLIRAVTLHYPNQSLWQLISVVKSNQPSRRSRGQEILHKLKGTKDAEDVGRLIDASLALTEGLLGLCNNPLHGHEKKNNVSMTKFFPKLYGMLPLPVIIPLQESLRAVLPSTPSAEAHHQPFPPSAPTFHHFDDDIQIMRSLARPRKLTITGSDGKTYTFLGKPKDDLRKDARLMDFNAIINKQLKSNSESRRRQLYIRTYGVVTLNEECGFIQWVPDTTPMRFIIQDYYTARGLPAFDARMQAVFDKLGLLREKDAAELFEREILTRFQPVMHQWFVETFPEPAAWLSSRIAYTRTSAVMSMVGFILGLGDRHCENILLDTRSGDAVHVDFNCLFDKGKKLQTPERVPFRCTQNVVDGFGVTGVEGPFRIACEITMQALRDNRDCLSAVLDAFIHDPLVEWQDEKREKERSARRGNQVKESTDLLALAHSALQPIRKKLEGYYSLSRDKDLAKEIPISSMVEVLITEATDLKNLSKMYIGWSPFY